MLPPLDLGGVHRVAALGHNTLPQGAASGQTTPCPMGDPKAANPGDGVVALGSQNPTLKVTSPIYVDVSGSMF